MSLFNDKTSSHYQLVVIPNQIVLKLLGTQSILLFMISRRAYYLSGQCFRVK